MHACHEGVVVELGLEVECDPEGEDGEAEEAAGEDGEELCLVCGLVDCETSLLVVMALTIEK